jgi:Transposase
VTTNKAMYRAFLLYGELRCIYRLSKEEAPERLDAWLAWASRSRLKPFIKLARTIRQHKQGVLAAIELGLSNRAGFHPPSVLPAPMGRGASTSPTARAGSSHTRRRPPARPRTRLPRISAFRATSYNQPEVSAVAVSRSWPQSGVVRPRWRQRGDAAGVRIGLLDVRIGAGGCCGRYTRRVGSSG